MDMKFPSIKREIANLIEDQEGNITRGKMLSIGSMVILLGILLSTDIFAGHSSHFSHSSHKSHSSTSYHRSHVSHTSHSSYSHSNSHSSHASHSNTHSSHASHTNTHSSHASHANTHSSHASHASNAGQSYYASDSAGDVTPAAVAIGASALGGGIAIHKIKKARGNKEKEIISEQIKTSKAAAVHKESEPNLTFAPSQEAPKPKSDDVHTFNAYRAPNPASDQKKTAPVHDRTEFNNLGKKPPAPARHSNLSQILETYVLSALKDGRWHRLSEIKARIPDMKEPISIQRIAAICNRLKDEGVLEKKKESNVVYFCLRKTVR